jgi:hypothetical protein
LEARSILKNNASHDCEIPCRAGWLKEKEHSEKKRHITDRYIRWDIFDKRESFFDVKDYILIDDYYMGLKNIHTKPEYNKNEENYEILYLAERALGNIDWKKYLPERPLFTTSEKSNGKELARESSKA